MPEVSRFFGIVIAMYYRDHAPPHFHARYGDHLVQVDITTGAVRSGRFPPRALRLVLEWLDIHRDELLEDWQLVERGKTLKAIDPLE